jgi:hypothetical protein
MSLRSSEPEPTPEAAPGADPEAKPGAVPEAEPAAEAGPEARGSRLALACASVALVIGLAILADGALAGSPSYLFLGGVLAVLALACAVASVSLPPRAGEYLAVRLLIASLTVALLVLAWWPISDVLGRYLSDLVVHATPTPTHTPLPPCPACGG